MRVFHHVRVYLVAALLIAAFAAACGRGNTVAPSAPSSAIVGALAPGQTPSGFGVAVVRTDVSQCFAFAGDPACFSGARLHGSAVTGGAATPAAPSGLTATASGSTVTLAWLAPSGTDPADAYLIEAGSAPGLANLANFSTGSRATTFLAGGVGNGTYYVRVRAQNASGTSAASNESVLVVGAAGCTTAPNAPSGLAISASGSTVTLGWSAPAGGCPPTSYLLQAGSSVGQSDLANSSVGNTTSYVATGVGNGTYYVRVRATNADGQSAASNEFTLVVGTGPAPGVTGRWVGLVPDGVVFDPRSDLCDSTDDLQFDLTQTGTVVTGTVTMRVRTFKSPLPFANCNTAGSGVSTAVNGTVNGTSFSFPYSRATISGTVAGNRMTGILIGGGDGSQIATFAVTRQ